MAMPDKKTMRPELVRALELSNGASVPVLVLLALADEAWAREEAAERAALLAADLANSAEPEAGEEPA